MIYAYFDSGTTNSRIFLLENGQILYHSKIKTGCKDAALAGDSSVLIEALWKLYQNALVAMHLQDEQIRGIYLSGMATSANGLQEVEHLPLPAGLKELRENMVEYPENRFFHRSLYLIPGLKTCPRGVRVSPEKAVLVNNVRGEETEIMGILQATGMNSCAVLLPGSHTQAAIVENGKITDLLSTVTGELYGAILQDTIIGSSVTEAAPQPDWIKQGVLALRRFGFNRALYITRSLDLFSDTKSGERKNFLEGVVNGDMVLEALRVIQRHPSIQDVIIYGSCDQYTILQAVAEVSPGFENFSLHHVEADPDFPMSVRGIMALCEEKFFRPV